MPPVPPPDPDTTLDPAESAPDVRTVLATTLRRLRGSWSQDHLAALVQYSRETVSAVEHGTRWPTYDFLERCDLALEANGALIDLWPALVEERRTSRRRRSPSPLPNPAGRPAPRRWRTGIVRRCNQARVFVRRHRPKDVFAVEQHNRWSRQGLLLDRPPTGVAVEFVPSPFAIYDSAVRGWGMTLPDGSAVLVDWRNGPSSVVAVCQSPTSAARLVGGDLLWLTPENPPTPGLGG
jgi:DNA-binding XRE family transcriptional regulator